MLFNPLHSLVKLLWLNHLWITNRDFESEITNISDSCSVTDLAQEASLHLFPIRSERLTGAPGASKAVICIPSHETSTSCSDLLTVCVRAQNPSNLNWSWHPINSNSNRGSFFFFQDSNSILDQVWKKNYFAKAADFKNRGMKWVKTKEIMTESQNRHLEKKTMAWWDGAQKEERTMSGQGHGEIRLNLCSPRRRVETWRKRAQVWIIFFWSCVIRES